MEILLDVKRQTGITPVELRELPKMPDELLYVWEWYSQLRGAQPLTNLELLSWTLLYSVEPSSQEMQLLKDLDSTYWSVIHE